MARSQLQENEMQNIDMQPPTKYLGSVSLLQPKDYAEILVQPGEDGSPTVYAAGKLLGPAKEVVEFILDGAASVERHRAPLPPWLEKARSAFQRTE